MGNEGEDMSRYKTHLIAVKKSNNEEKMIMRDIRDAMQYLVIIISNYDTTETHYNNPIATHTRADNYHQPSATHHYYNDAKVTPFAQHCAHN